MKLLSLKLLRVLEVLMAMVAVFVLTGCNNPLLPPRQSRNTGYDLGSEPAINPHQEPYATFVGYASNGGLLYLIHWQGNALNNQSCLEHEIDTLNIPKFYN